MRCSKPMYTKYVNKMDYVIESIFYIMKYIAMGTPTHISPTPIILDEPSMSGPCLVIGS